MAEQQARGDNPYPGPRPFTRQDRLYGRTRETDELRCLLVAERIVLLYSPSGAGKTSLVQASLIPDLEKQGFRVLGPARVSLEATTASAPAPSANRYVFSTLLSLEASRSREDQQRLDQLVGQSLSDYLDSLPPYQLPATAAETDADWEPEESPGDVLIFDQFEEVLTIDPTDERGKLAFFEQVGQALRNRRRWALFSMREEFIAGLDSYRQAVPTRLTNRYRLDLLSLSAAMEAIQGPAAAATPRVTFTPEAARKLAENLSKVRVRRPGGEVGFVSGLYVEPVQLQVVCRRLWNQERPDRAVIAPTDIKDEGGDVETALAEYYADSVAAIAETQAKREAVVEPGATESLDERTERNRRRREALIRDWIDGRLITASGLRGQVLLETEATQGLDAQTIWALVDTHLVRAEERRGSTWFELAHDRLIDPVRKNNEKWRTDNLSELERQARLWNAQDRPDGLLLLGPALVAAEEWAKGRELESYQMEFLEECRKAETAAELDRRQRRRIRNLAIAATCLMVVALILAGIAYAARTQAEKRRVDAEAARTEAVEAQGTAESARAEAVVAQGQAEAARVEAVRQAQLANSRALAAASVAALDRDPELSILVAQASDAVTRTAEAEDALRRALLASRIVRRLTIPPPATAPGANEHKANTAQLTRAVFSPDGERLAISGLQAGVAIFDLEQPDAPALVLPLARENAGAVTDIAFSRDGWRLATAHGASDSGESADNTARIWDARTGERQLTLKGHVDGVTSVAFSPDGNRLATGSLDKSAKVWDLSADGALFAEMYGHSEDVTAVAFSPDGRLLATASRDNSARLWDAASSADSLVTLIGHTDKIVSLAFSPDGVHLATGSTDKTGILWDLTDLSNPKAAQTLFDHTDTVAGVRFSQYGQCLATASLDRTARIWDVETARLLLTLAGHEDGLESAVFRPEPGVTQEVAEVESCGHELATASYDGTARLWNIGPTSEKAAFLGHLAPVESVVYSLDGSRVASGSDDGAAKIWDAATGRMLLNLSGWHTGRVNRVAFSPDGVYIATASWDGGAGLWEAATGKFLLRLEASSEIGARRSRGHMQMQPHRQAAPPVQAGIGRDLASIRTFRAEGRALQGLAFSPDGKTLATAGDSGQVDLWDIPSGRKLEATFWYGRTLFSVLFSPDGKQLLATGEQGAIHIWDIKTGEERLLEHGLQEVYDAAFSPDGRRLASVSWDGTAKVWSWPEGKLVSTFRGHTDRVYGVRFTPDGRQLATSSGDRTARIWDLATGRIIRTLYGPELNGLDTSKDSTTVAIGGEDGTVRLYTLDPNELFALAKDRVTRELTHEERAQYLPATASQ